MARVLWNDATGRAHAIALGNAPRESGTHRCTALCVRALATERLGASGPHTPGYGGALRPRLEIDAPLQLTLRLRVTHVLPAAADECEAVILRRADVPEPTASNAADALYVLALCACDDPLAPPHVVWGCGPDLLVNCVLPSDTRVPDLFPLSLVRRHAMRALRAVLTELQPEPRVVSTEEVEAVLGDSWLDCESVDACAMPERCSTCHQTGWALGSHGLCRRCSSIGDPSNGLH